MMRSSVVLPHPDGPTKHTSSPAGTERSTDFSAVKAPNDLWMPSRRSASPEALMPSLRSATFPHVRGREASQALRSRYLGAAFDSYRLLHSARMRSRFFAAHAKSFFARRFA